MKTKIGNWFRGHKALRVLFPGVILLLLVGALFIPYAQAALTYLDIEGTYTVNSTLGAKYLDGTKHANMVGSTLTITTQTNQVISSASLTMFGDTVDLTGLVGSGSRPWISLTGNDGTDTYLSITGRVSSSGDVVKGISGGVITGYTISDGYKWELSDTGTAATYTGANSYGGSGYCALLTAGAGAGAECVQFNLPVNTFKLSQLKTLAASTSNGLSFYYNLQNTKSPGPQVGLRFAPAGVTGTDLFSSVSHVDITIAPFYSTTGDGTWKQYNITKDSERIYYYGNAPDNQASFSQPGSYLATLSLAEDEINQEPEMLNGTAASASNWVLTAVYIDLYEAGVRTCYIDNVQIGRYTYTLEPEAFSCAFKAKISD